MTDKRNMRYQYLIYKISSDYCDKFYIGSTRDFTTRKSSHKSNCNNPNAGNHNTKIYRTIRENGGWNNWNMVCIEVMENTTKLEAEIREEQMRMSLKAKLNDKMVTRGYITREEYKKQHYQENKDHYDEYYKKYCEENRDHLKDNKKQYYEANKDHLKEYHKQHYEANKDKINEKCDCECGARFLNRHKARHSKTIKHQRYLDTLGKSISI
jgi:hypothetical protein